MHPAEEMIERMKWLRAGKEVSCKQCKTGVMRPIGDHKITHCFKCDKCGTKLNIN